MSVSGHHAEWLSLVEVSDRLFSFVASFVDQALGETRDKGETP